MSECGGPVLPGSASWTRAVRLAVHFELGQERIGIDDDVELIGTGSAARWAGMKRRGHLCLADLVRASGRRCEQRENSDQQAFHLEATRGAAAPIAAACARMSRSRVPVRSASAIELRASSIRPALKYAQASASSVKMSWRSDAAFSAMAIASAIL